jgi:hypothetical protein
MDTNARTPEEFTHDFATSIQEFTDQFGRQLAAARNEGDANENLRPEACAAIWAATQLVYSSSVLAPHERKELLRLLTRAMVPFWQKHCAGAQAVAGAQAQIPAEPATPSSRPGSFFGAANQIVGELMLRLGIEHSSSSVFGRVLATALANRMFADLRWINEYKRQIETRRRRA